MERYNAMLQHLLIKLVNDNQTDWDVHLNGVLFACCTLVHKSTGFTPFEIMFGRLQMHTHIQYTILFNFRKAVLPIETENNDSTNYMGPHQYEDGEDAEQICTEMRKIKEVIDGKAIKNNNVNEFAKMCLVHASDLSHSVIHNI